MNQDYDFSDYFPVVIMVYKFFGFWKPDQDMKFKRLYNYYTAFCITAWVIFLLSQMIYIVINRGDVKEVTAALYVTILLSTIFVKVMCIYSNMDQMKLLIKKFNGPLFQVKCQKHYDLVEDKRRMIEIIYKFCLYLGVQTDIFYGCIPFFVKERITLIKGWFPYDWNDSLNYILTYIFQYLVFVWNTLLCFATDISTFTLLLLVSTQCEVLCVTLNSLDEFYTDNGVLYEASLEHRQKVRRNREVFSEEMSKNLVVCIRHYKEIMSAAKEVTRIHEAGLFCTFLAGAIILCCCLFQLSMVGIGSLEFFTLLFYLMCMITEQLLYCWFGSEIIYKSSLILDATYNTPWVECNTKFRKILLQFMTQACFPISIKVGGLFTMSIPLYVSVMKTSYSYFTLLQRIQ